MIAVLWTYESWYYVTYAAGEIRDQHPDKPDVIDALVQRYSGGKSSRGRRFARSMDRIARNNPTDVTVAALTARVTSTHLHDDEVIPVSMLKQAQPQPGLRVFKPETARAVREMLRMAAGPGGTAPKAQTMGYSVGGKTGTAHKQEGRGYADRKYRGFFVGVAPVDNPRIVVAVMIDEPSGGKYFGGDVAAPVFSATVQQTLRLLGVQPDMNVKPQIVVEAVEESF